MSETRSRIVAKYGSSSVVDGRGGIDQTKLNDYAAEWKQYRNPAEGPMGLAIVSSGAVAVGRSLWQEYFGNERPLPERSELASIGSDEASVAWRSAFGKGPERVLTGQILTTHYDLHMAGHGDNKLLATLDGHLERGTVPIINENDATKSDELVHLARDGDPDLTKRYSPENDGTASLTAQVVGARALILFGQTRGILGPDGQPIREIPFDHTVHADILHDLEPAQRSSVGTGGPALKLEAGIAAASAGIAVYVAHAEADIDDIFEGRDGTYIMPKPPEA